jgi:hypothetical protein
MFPKRMRLPIHRPWFLPQPLLDDLHTTCYHESGIWRIFGLPDATAPVAQWIEHLTSNLVAVGSSPAGRATVHNLLHEDKEP